MSTATKHLLTPGEFLAWRKGRRWTQAQAGERLGIAESTVRHYEDGTRRVSPAIQTTMNLLDKLEL